MLAGPFDIFMFLELVSGASGVGEGQGRLLRVTVIAANGWRVGWRYGVCGCDVDGMRYGKWLALSDVWQPPGYRRKGR